MVSVHRGTHQCLSPLCYSRPLVRAEGPGGSWGAATEWGQGLGSPRGCWISPRLLLCPIPVGACTGKAVSSISEASPTWGRDGHGTTGHWSSMDPHNSLRDVVCDPQGGQGQPWGDCQAPMAPCKDSSLHNWGSASLEPVSFLMSAQAMFSRAG